MFGDNPGAWIDEMRTEEQVAISKEGLRILKQWEKDHDLDKAINSMINMWECGL